MKYLPLFLTIIMVYLTGCESKYKYDLDMLCHNWVADYEITTEYDNGIISKQDTSKFCWLFSDSDYHLRMFKDSTYIVLDTVWRNGIKYIEPTHKGRFIIKNDSLKFKSINFCDVETSILELTDDTLVLQRIFNDGQTARVEQTRFVNSHMNSSFDTFDFPKNKIDTTTIIEGKSLMGIDGKILQYTHYERAYTYNQDTILHLIEELPIFEQIDTDSILNYLDNYFNAYNLGEYGDQRTVRGHDFAKIDCTFDEYITYYYEMYCYNKGYIGAFHGDWNHRYSTYSFDGTRLLLSDIITRDSKDYVNDLISDAVLAYKRKTGWLGEGEYDDYYLGKKLLYSSLNYNKRVAIGKDGLIVSLDYSDSDTDISFAENYINAIVPYHKLRPYLKYPFDKLAK